MTRGVDTAGKRAGPSQTRKRPVSSLQPVNMTSKRARTRNIAKPLQPSRIQPTRKRSLKGKEKATSSDEEPGEPAANEAQPASEVREASSSQSSHVSTASGPQSTSTTSLESEETAVSRMQKEIALKDELLQKQAGTFSALQNILQCQICLEMLWRPYSLTPCGHVACEACLVSWFSQRVEGGQDIEMPLLAPAMKKKTCPTCRAEVRSRPLVAYLIKSALQTVLPCLDPSTYDKMAPASSQRPEDPWKGIFPDELGPNAVRHRDNIRQAHPEVIIDDDDGGVPRCPVCLHEIFDGVCTGCARLYAGISDDEDNDDIESNGGILPWQRFNFPGVPAGPAGWNYSDEDLSEDDEPYESSFIEDDDDDGNAELHRGFDDQHDADLHPHPPARRTRRARNAPNISTEEEQAPPPNPEHWQSYLTRAARRHGNVDAVSAPIYAGAQDVSRVADMADESDESDWAPRPRRQRLARETRRRNPQNNVIVIYSDEDDDSDHGRMPSYISDDEDIIIPPLSLRRRARRRVVSVEISEDGDSENDVFEDAVSTEGRTVTSAGRQSSRYDPGTSHDEESDSHEAHVVRHRDPMSEDDNLSRRWPSGHDVDSSSDVHGSAHDSSEDSDDASDEASDSSL